MGDANVNIFLPFNARKMKFYECYLRGKSANLANFQPNLTSRSKVNIFVILFTSWGVDASNSEHDLMLRFDNRFPIHKPRCYKNSLEGTYK